jgi:hypothetical protein
VIPTQILRVLSTIRRFDVPALLMGGQACVLYGAAEYSRDIDLAVLATEPELPRLGAAMEALHAHVIAVPPFASEYLERGHAVHFSVPGGGDPPLRVDIMSRMRGVAPFGELWNRRTTLALAMPDGGESVAVDLLALEDLVSAKKTQSDKDWPMIRRLVDASYDAARDMGATEELAPFWIAELRTPEFLEEAVARFGALAAGSTRPAVRVALAGGDLQEALLAEQASEMAADREFWLPLRRELESLRRAARRS